MIDYGNGAVQPPQLPFAAKSENIYTDVHVCSDKGILFASSKDDPNLGVISIFKVAKRHRGSVSSRTDVGPYAYRWLRAGLHGHEYGLHDACHCHRQRGRRVLCR